MQKLITLLLTSLITSSAFADWTKLPATNFSVEAPPSATETLKELETILDIQKKRSQEDCAVARSMQIPTYTALFAKAPLTRGELQRAKALTEKTLSLAEHITDFYKEKFHRTRPYNEDSRIHPCVIKPGGAKSYPSSHASMAAIGSCVLKEIYPNRARELVKYGEYLGNLRVIVGVHHPSDVRAGQKLAEEICDTLLRDRDFQTELMKLK